MNKAILFIASMALLTFISCKKDTAAASKSYYLKMKVNGVLKQYDSCHTFETQISLGGSDMYYQINVLAGKPGDYAGVGVSGLVPIDKGTYLSKGQAPGDEGLVAFIGAYREPGSSDIYDSFDSNAPYYADNIKVVISEWDSEHCSGTFSGEMKLVGGNKILTISDGEFKAVR